MPIKVSEKDQGKAIMVFAKDGNQYRKWFNEVGRLLPDSITVKRITDAKQLRGRRSIAKTHLVILDDSNPAVDSVKKNPKYNGRYIDPEKLYYRVRGGHRVATKRDQVIDMIAAGQFSGLKIEQERALV